MARFYDQLIDQIKQAVSLVQLVEAKGFTLKPHGSTIPLGSGPAG